VLDLKFIRENSELVLKAVADRQTQAPVAEILEIDGKRRNQVAQLDDLRRQRKELARQKGVDAADEGRRLRDELKSQEETLRRLDDQLTDLLLRVPNIPDPSVPMGRDENDNVVLRHWGDMPTFNFKPAPHWELGERLGIIDFERGAKLSGSRFYVLNGPGARLQRALIAYMLDLHTLKHGYREVYPPFMVKKYCMVGSGNLPKFADNLYHDEEDDLWFVPTAEVDEIIPPGMLPLKYTAYTACFRREKMSAGKDTRGIKRGHQFDKVEIYKFTEPEASNDELDSLLKDAEDVCRGLGLPYRVKQLCTADLGFAAAKSYDIEMWAPGIDEWLEVSSCSNTGNFQARRTNIRYRPSAESRPEFVHTLNGSGLALPRVLIAVMENCQQADGSIAIPEALQPFMGMKTIS
jgi:seryl-tRNA synthetase